MTKKRKSTGALDNLREALQILPIKGAGLSRDKRSAKRGKKLVRELEKRYRPSDIAGALEVSTQKYVAIRKRIKKGRIADSTLNDLLESARPKAEKIYQERFEGYPKDMRGDYISDKPVGRKRKFKIDYVETSQEYMEQKIKWAVSIKPGGFASKQSALNWYGGVTGGKEYFKIVKGSQKRHGKSRYYIYDTRTQAEKSRKGSVSGSTRADRIIERDMMDDE